MKKSVKFILLLTITLLVLALSSCVPELLRTSIEDGTPEWMLKKQNESYEFDNFQVSCDLNMVYIMDGFVYTNTTAAKLVVVTEEDVEKSYFYQTDEFYKGKKRTDSMVIKKYNDGEYIHSYYSENQYETTYKYLPDGDNLLDLVSVNSNSIEEYMKLADSVETNKTDSKYTLTIKGFSAEEIDAILADLGIISSVFSDKIDDFVISMELDKDGVLKVLSMSLRFKGEKINSEFKCITSLNSIGTAEIDDKDIDGMSSYKEIKNPKIYKTFYEKINSIRKADNQSFNLDVTTKVSLNNNINTVNTSFDYSVGKIDGKVFYDLIQTQNYFNSYARYYNGTFISNAGSQYTTVNKTDADAYAELLTISYYFYLNSGRLTGVKEFRDEESGVVNYLLTFDNDGGNYLDPFFGEEIESVKNTTSKLNIIVKNGEITSIDMEYKAEDVIIEGNSVAVNLNIISKITFDKSARK